MSAGPELTSAQQTLVARHVRHAQRLVWHFATDHGPARDELVAVAYEGLCRAAARYRATRGPFWKYAQFWVRRELHRAVLQTGPVHRSHHHVEPARRMATAARRLSQTLNRQPSIDEIAAATGATPQGVQHAHDVLYPTYTDLDEAVHRIEGPETLELLPRCSPLVQSVLATGSVQRLARATRTPIGSLRARLMSELRRYFRA